MRRLSASVLAGIGLALASACDAGSDLVGVRVPVPLAVVPVFAVAPTAEEVAVLDLLRVTLRSARDSSVVKTQVLNIDPDSAEWSIEMTVEVPAGQGPSLSFYLETELADTDGPLESVEWSGRTQAFPLQSPDRPLELRQVNLYRGPLANLGLTRVTFSRASLGLVEGATSSLQWLTQGDTAGTVLYLAVGNTGVATVDRSGLLQTQGIGATKVFVYGGTVQDSLLLEVAGIYLPPSIEVTSTIQPQLDYVLSDLFISTFHDPAAAETLRAPITEVSSALQARDGPVVVEAFEATKAAWKAYGSGTPLRYTDGPQLGVLELTLIRVAAALRTAFP